MASKSVVSEVAEFCDAEMDLTNDRDQFGAGKEKAPADPKIEHGALG